MDNSREGMLDAIPPRKPICAFTCKFQHRGTELESAEERAMQASSSRPRELQVLELLTAREAQHAPTLLGQKEVIQGDNGWVPGGSVFYILWNELDGIRLGEGDGYKNYFWNSLMPPRREEIRKAFKVAYEYAFHPFFPFTPRELTCQSNSDFCTAGVDTVTCGLECLVWNESRKEM